MRKKSELSDRCEKNVIDVKNKLLRDEKTITKEFERKKVFLLPLFTAACIYRLLCRGLYGLSSDVTMG